MTLLEHIKLELKAILTNPVVTLTVFGGVIFYSFLYPLPYTQQTPREQPIAVVNLDSSQTSFQLERMVDATPNVTVTERLYTIEDAKQSFLQGDITGFIVIPEHFYKDLMLGKSPVLSYAGDAALFLVYGTVVEGLAQAGGTLAAKTKVTKLLIDGVPLELASHQYAATRLNSKPTFNPRMGYVDYVVPAVFVLILQQTLAMASGLIGGTQRQGSGYWQTQSVFSVLAVRTGILLLIYYLLSVYYFGASFNMYGISTLAQPLELLTLMLPFLLVSCFIGVFVGAITPRRELVTVVVLLSSMPLVFSAGFIWPSEMLPAPIRWVAAMFPTQPAINGFLKLNQMGASWSQISGHWTQLWLQVLAWGGLAYWSFTRNRASKTD
ncbi:ABC transporter [Vibrio sp. 10N.286.49.C2]|uniref:ABC transporter permease n=1 Tax=unclassified Vibrio TaxID=2614977 RepID=UPI000C8654EF|nr:MULTISPECIES: ABC transporter permease [unclassified Vibrio]PMH31609.1 ABC transporter [Vibrio sp. 10N.286.49.C2]PMH50631.1 ABC transporter [Vibrio sp. 10N.286.49.B1]PMH82799.1 ABC transporter [Vibrio sp. 10N.286.48.B7]